MSKVIISYVNHIYSNEKYFVYLIFNLKNEITIYELVILNFFSLNCLIIYNSMLQNIVQCIYILIYIVKIIAWFKNYLKQIKLGLGK